MSICHIPPDDPANAHTISIKPNAVPAHLAHGDHLGPCIGGLARWDGTSETKNNKINSENLSKIILESYPNPFSNITVIKFSLPTTEKALLSINNISGKQVSILFDKEAEKNIQYNIVFDATVLPGGVYFYQLITTTQIYTKKLVIIK